MSYLTLTSHCAAPHVRTEIPFCAFAPIAVLGREREGRWGGVGRCGSFRRAPPAGLNVPATAPTASRSCRIRILWRRRLGQNIVAEVGNESLQSVAGCPLDPPLNSSHPSLASLEVVLDSLFSAF